MPRPSRFRRIAKWSGVVVCVLVVGAFVLSLFRTAGHFRGSRWVWVSAGMLHVDLDRIPAFPVWFSIPRTKDPYTWLPTRAIGAMGGTNFAVPFWMLFAAVVLPTAYLFYRDRRHPRGHCQECGYDLTGNVTGVCSECGKTA